MGDDRRPLLLALHASRLLFIACEDVECHSFKSRVIGRMESGNFALLSQRRSLPVIAYTEEIGAPLMLVKCHDRSCTSSTQEQVAAFDYDAWQIVTDRDDVVVMARRTDGSLFQLRCPNLNCSAHVVSPVTQNVRQFAMSAAPNVVWVFAVSSTEDRIETFKCNDAACSRVAVNSAARPSGDWALDVAAPPSAHGSVSAALTLNPVGTDDGGGSSVVQLLTCSGAECSISEVVAAPATNTTYVRLAMRSDGFPVLALTDRGNDASRVILCHDAQCRSLRAIELGRGAIYTVSVGADDLPLVVSAADPAGLIELTRCTDTTCAETVAATIDLRSIGQHKAPRGTP